MKIKSVKKDNDRLISPSGSNSNSIPLCDFSLIYNRFPAPVTTIDSHTEGETTRLVVDGIGEIFGSTMMEKLSFFKSSYDNIRCMLTREPRGSREILAAVVTENVSPDAAFGLIYMDAKRYPYLCGHATIGAVTSLFHAGALNFNDGENRVLVDTPSGIMDARAAVRDGNLISVAINMVPSFVFATDQSVDVKGFGNINVDIVCTGGFFAMVDSDSIGIEPVIENREVLVDLGMKIIDAANEQLEISHPLRPDVKTVDVTEFYNSDVKSGVKQGRGVVVYGESHMDRSPCGTGTAAKLALLYHKNRLEMNLPYINYSPLGTSLQAKLVEKTMIGDKEALVTRIQGRAWITGFHNFVIDSSDPFQDGFLI
ncbi:PrdF1 [Desulfamplus magnetovallimortis]|uniref:PrdF1 n=1 Tax=Desulfamplus magnetovallimortis TaxID=1246637 RepID=A0A1W1H7U2_9BACT|nr:proline racemase family protein [Desulfamplus magnetovallimortis]SLM28455.1 PrdF1 [Desulfamplus magnetovallimortis]